MYDREGGVTVILVVLVPLLILRLIPGETYVRDCRRCDGDINSWAGIESYVYLKWCMRDVVGNRGM